jgi:homoserine kinase type II
MVKSFFEGKIMDDLPPHVLSLIGKKLGQLHQLAPVDYLPKILPLGYENFHLVNEYAKSSPFSKWLFGIKDYVQPYLDLNLPKALIHSDLFSNNVVVSYDETRITILDFEEATNYYRIFDLGMAIIGLCSVNKIIDAEKLTQLLIGYCQIISLTANEQAALQAFTVYAGASMALWRHRNFNHIHPEMGFKNHFKALQILANFAKNQSPDFFRIN